MAFVVQRHSAIALGVVYTVPEIYIGTTNSGGGTQWAGNHSEVKVAAAVVSKENSSADFAVGDFEQTSVLPGVITPARLWHRHNGHRRNRAGRCSQTWIETHMGPWIFPAVGASDHCAWRVTCLKSPEMLYTHFVTIDI
jgi:hypothetical protein